MAKAATFGDLNPKLRINVQRGHMRTALRILHAAWPATNLDPRVAVNADEDEITDVLRREMVRIKKAMKPSPRFRIEREPQSDIVDDNSPLGLIDIQIGYSFDEVLYIAIECKRINSTGNTLARRYVREGINRFVTCKYSGGHALAGMVGYVICGNRDQCVERVRKQVEKAPIAITGFDADAGWAESTVWVPSEIVYESHHRQAPTGHRICLVHSYLRIT